MASIAVQLRDRLRRGHGNLALERSIAVFLVASALVSVLSTFGIIVVLFAESVPFFKHVSLWDFLTGTTWTPLLNPRQFGVVPLIVGTMHIVVGAGLIGLPLGLATAIYLSEYASPRARNFLKPFLEILAGIPTVVYGYFALTFVTPMLRHLLGEIQLFNSLSAAIVVGIMILPLVASLCEDALRAVPQSLRDGAYALGATKLEVTLRVVVPSALSGVMAAFILALSRAIGETMAVTLAAGATPNLTFNMLESIQTMTAFIVQVSLGDTPRGTVEYQALFAVGALLFVITLLLNIASSRILKRFRETYE
jgi:phosphate transport system permease protein